MVNRPTRPVRIAQRRRWGLAGVAVVAVGATVVIGSAAGAGSGSLKIVHGDKDVPSAPADSNGRTQLAVGCPASHPHVTGGGLQIIGDDPNFDLETGATSVLGDGRGWFAEANNSSGNQAEMTVDAICAKGRFRYPDVDRARVPGEQVQRGVNCPHGFKLTGGGVDTDGNFQVEVASTRPDDGPDRNSKPDDRWVGSANNGGMTVTAVCAKAGSYKYVHSARKPLPDNSRENAVARCPAGTRVTGGGVDTTGIDAGLEVKTSSANPRFWFGSANNDNTGHDEKMQVFAICKKV
jgi:hypothetical protein